MLLLLLLAARPALAFDGHQVSAGDLTVLIEDIPVVAERNTPIPVRVTLTNSGERPIAGSVEIRDMVDDSRVVGASRQAFGVEPQAKTTVDFAIAFGDGTYSALYPVHAHVDFTQGDENLSAHAIRIVTTRFDDEAAVSRRPTPMQPLLVPERGALPLQPSRKHRAAWNSLDGAATYARPGCQGDDPVSRASLRLRTVTRGEAMKALAMHPPWTPIGSVFCDYLLKLPDARPLRLTFANAIRDSTPEEPVSDGVLFRVWASRDATGADRKLLYEQLTGSKTWLPGEADLSAFAGETILLRLESHPGLAENTFCDLSYWGNPTIVAGEPPEETGPTFAEAARENERIGREIIAGKRKPDNALTFRFRWGEDDLAAVIRPTERGIVDGVLTFVGPSSAVSFDGFGVEIMRQPAIRRPRPIVFRGHELKWRNGHAVHVHHLERDGKPIDLAVHLWPDQINGLRVAFECDERITDFHLGAADREAQAVYYGHGYRIVEPEAFVAHFGGHDLSTSHIGCDFEGGMSILQATDVPPDRFEVNPAAKQYALHSHLNGTLTLVPSEAGALRSAGAYRQLYDKPAAGGVRRLAGRFCFDIWGGRYADIADRMAEMIRYGLTDSILTVHVWQRWGYDYRLPDMWPPDPRLGTIDDMRRIAEVCRQHDIPWGLHDDYVCIFPDATDFSYDLVRFSEDGQPLKHWYTESRDAQSYAFRADRIMPFVQRNLRWIKDGVAPTHYFLDVFTSEPPLDYYDREGNFHPSTETRRKWGDVFKWISEHLFNGAPTTSEAGHDQLIGYLDGADCQHLRITDKPQRFCLPRRCKDWERVPWFDAVNHDRFILHGVGYSGRYQGGRDRRDHGINSDDYISDEILLGHALMVDQWCWGSPAVRKYWLAQDVARNLALKTIEAVEFAGGDMHRQIVSWSNRTKVYVNRGESDWRIEGHTLPQYGYLVLGDGLMSVIEERGGVICESSIGPNGWYCNARTHDPDRPLRISPRVENFRYLGDREFTYDMVWQADEPAPRDMMVYVHFYGADTRPDRRIPFQDDHRPQPLTNEWSGTVRYDRTITVPEDADGEYTIAWGIYDSEGILRLTGPLAKPATGTPVWVGTLQVKREAGRIADITLKPPPEPGAAPPERTNPEGKVIDFGFAATDGAFRVEKTKRGPRLTPLPDHPPFEVTLSLDHFALVGKRVKRIVALDGETDVDFEQRRHFVTFRHDGESFCYSLEL